MSNVLIPKLRKSRTKCRRLSPVNRIKIPWILWGLLTVVFAWESHLTWFVSHHASNAFLPIAILILTTSSFSAVLLGVICLKDN